MYPPKKTLSWNFKNFLGQHQNITSGKLCRRMSLLLTLMYFTPCSSVSFVNFEHVNADWVCDSYENNSHTETPYKSCICIPRNS